jgi:hypothetical protein
MITLALVLSFAAILRGVAWIAEGFYGLAHPEPPQTWDDLDADFEAYAERRGREYLAEQRLR